MRAFTLRAAALLLAALCLAGCLAGCGSTGPEEPEPDVSAPLPAEPDSPALLADYDFVLPWYRGEGYNPYLTDNSLTVQLADLLFEKLVIINPDAVLEYRAVRRVDNAGTAVTLTVDTSRRYADGTAVSAQDVAASLEAARGSLLYRGRFANVTSVRAEEGLVHITLREPDPLFIWLLDIPVMPAGQTGAARPTASGRYTYAPDGDALVPNPMGSGAPFRRIELCEMTGADALANSLNIGAISLYSSEAEGRANGINSSRQIGFYTNTQVFLGFNSIAWRQWKTVDADGVETWHSEPTGSSPLLADPRGRQAVEALLDRTYLLEKVYYNQGHVASGYLNTVGAAGGRGLLTPEKDREAAAALLESMNCRMGLDGYYHLDDGTWGGEKDPANRLELRLLVYSGSSYKRYLAQLIREELDDFGIAVTVVPADSMENYRQLLASLNFDMYIGEIKLYNNMDMSAFLTETGAANAGVSASDTLLTTWADWKAGTADASAFEQALTGEMCWAPILWRSGTLYYTKALEGFSPSASSIFYGMEDLRLS